MAKTEFTAPPLDPDPDLLLFLRRKAARTAIAVNFGPCLDI